MGGKDAVNNAPSYAAAAANPVGRGPVYPLNSISPEQRAYWRARRSARLSPVEGNGEKELWEGVEKFLFKLMRIPTTDVRESDVVSVRRVLTARGRQSRLEVCVVFVDAETRDRIATYAKNLGNYIENGKPTVTFRHDIPTHLSGVHKALMQYGYAMGKRYGKGFRKNVRFDDVSCSFCIDMLIPGTKSWITVQHHQAVADLQERAREAAEQRREVTSSRQSTQSTSSEAEEMEQGGKATDPSTPSATSQPSWGSNK